MVVPVINGAEAVLAIPYRIFLGQIQAAMSAAHHIAFHRLGRFSGGAFVEQAFDDQDAKIEANGGWVEVSKRGDFGYTPAPGQTPIFEG